MREANLLSPRRRPQGEAKLHAGTITTTQPNDMWGTSDGARIFTADEGWIWAFFCVDHWNSECLGHHVTKRGTRFAALEPAEVERGWRDIKHVLDLRPVYHRKEERIRAHVLLCWLALLLIRVCETSCADTWPNLRRELEKMKIGTFAGDAGTFRRRTDTTANQRAIFSRLTLTEPPKIQELTPVLSKPPEPEEPPPRIDTRPFRA